jgi:hypothetical protein
VEMRPRQLIRRIALRDTNSPTWHSPDCLVCRLVVQMPTSLFWPKSPPSPPSPLSTQGGVLRPACACSNQTPRAFLPGPVGRSTTSSCPLAHHQTPDTRPAQRAIMLPPSITPLPEATCSASQVWRVRTAWRAVRAPVGSKLGLDAAMPNYWAMFQCSCFFFLTVFVHRSWPAGIQSPGRQTMAQRKRIPMSRLPQIHAPIVFGGRRNAEIRRTALLTHTLLL